MSATLQFSIRQLLATTLLLAVWCAFCFNCSPRTGFAIEAPVGLGVLRISALAGLPAAYAGTIVGKLDQGLTLGVATAITAVIMCLQR